MKSITLKNQDIINIGDVFEIKSFKVNKTPWTFKVWFEGFEDNAFHCKVEYNNRAGYRSKEEAEKAREKYIEYIQADVDGVWVISNDSGVTAVYRKYTDAVKRLYEMPGEYTRKQEYSMSYGVNILGDMYCLTFWSSGHLLKFHEVN